MFVIFAVLFFVFFVTACYKSPIEPPDDPPVERKYFHIQIKYERPAGSILSPDQLFKGVGATVFADISCWGDEWNFGFGYPDQERIDDYHFPWSEPQLIPDNENGQIYSMYGRDIARWNGTDDTIIVGDIFFIRVQETGFEKKLTNIVQNSILCNPYKGPNSKMVLFRLKKNGTITDD
ncbi:hypothetical protein KKI21_02700 [Patescibacteria group bacterium]|nr:hypothetical protein [Patescibacteria group bacterium]MCG2696388.1 hypothetical protein [Candidatus Portnoybacteria bacterium]